jgi:uncharacterized protein (DUF433 family)
MSDTTLASVPTPPAAEVPLRWDNCGVWRVGRTNLTLETVVELFDSGLEADEIAREFDRLDLATVYSVIGYYLGHREELAAYLAARRAHAAETRMAGDAASQTMRERLEKRLNR